jgi:hypothetical protein
MKMQGHKHHQTLHKADTNNLRQPLILGTIQKTSNITVAPIKQLMRHWELLKVLINFETVAFSGTFLMDDKRGMKCKIMKQVLKQKKKLETTSTKTTM